MAPTPRHQVWNIISGLTADGRKTRRAPLRLWKGDEKALHALSMLAADMLATFRAAGVDPDDDARTSVLYRLIAFLAIRPRITLTKTLRQDAKLVASYIVRNPAHLLSEIPFVDLLAMARRAPRDPHRQDPEEQHWFWAWTLGIFRGGLEIGFAASLLAFAAVGFCIMPEFIISPRRFGQASLDAWRTLLAAPPCSGDCRIPTPPHGRRL